VIQTIRVIRFKGNASVIGADINQDRGGLSGENLKRYILMMRQGIDILKAVPSASTSIALPPMIRDFKVSEGRPLRSNCARD
jgi:hypothetical protein